MSKTTSGVQEQFAFLGKTLLLPLLVLATLPLLSRAMNQSYGFFLRDPSATAQISPVTGFVSHLGALAWCAAAAICLFSGRLFAGRGDDELARFSAWAGILSLALLADDLFMFHESVQPWLSERWIYVAYGLLLWGGLFRFRRCIRRSDYLVLLVALGLLAASTMVDALQYRLKPFLGENRILLEDGCKLLGIAAWLGYWARTCRRELLSQTLVPHLPRRVQASETTPHPVGPVTP